MGRLFQDNKEHTNRVVEKFAAAESKAGDLCQTLAALQDELYVVQTKEQFDGVVQKLIDQGKIVHHFLLELMSGVDKEVMPKVMAHLTSQPNFEHIRTLLNYTELAAKSIVAKKELLSVQESLTDLTDEQSEALLLFITKLKELKPITELLMMQEEAFKKRLGAASSLDEVDEIEAQIQKKNQLIEGALERLIPYPQDEVVAGQIIKLMQTNSHLLAILQSFDLHESLMNDILHARGTVVANIGDDDQPPPPSLSC